MVGMSSSPSWATLATMPKVQLHDHLDGSLRIGTLIECCQRRGLALPTHDEAELAAWFRHNAMAGSLERYLQGFALTVAAMGDVQALTHGPKAVSWPSSAWPHCCWRPMAWPQTKPFRRCWPACRAAGWPVA